jgi:superfamily I DNA and/or RNA helicase
MDNLEQYLQEKNLNKKIKKKTKVTFRNQYNNKLIKEPLKEKEYWKVFKIFSRNFMKKD